MPQASEATRRSMATTASRGSGGASRRSRTGRESTEYAWTEGAPRSPWRSGAPNLSAKKRKPETIERTSERSRCTRLSARAPWSISCKKSSNCDSSGDTGGTPVAEHQRSQCRQAAMWRTSVPGAERSNVRRTWACGCEEAKAAWAKADVPARRSTMSWHSAKQTAIFASWRPAEVAEAGPEPPETPWGKTARGRDCDGAPNRCEVPPEPTPSEALNAPNGP